MILRSLVVCGAILASAQPSARATCMATENVARLLTQPTAAIPDDGGVLVAWKSQGQLAGADRAALDASKWTFGGAAVTRETLAPGVTRIKRAQPGTLAITGGKSKIGTFARDAKAAAVALPAPKISGGELVTSPYHYGEPGTTMTLTLAEPIPDGAVGIIAYVVRDHHDVALSFGSATPGEKTVVPFTDANRCTFNPDGTQAPRPGEAPTFAFVDQFGRLSKQSAAVALKRIDKMPKQP